MSTARYVAGTSGKFTGTLRDPDGAALGSSSVTDLRLSLVNAETGATINSRDGGTNLVGGAQNVTLDSSTGALTWSVQTADTALATSTNSSEDHVATFIWTWSGGTGKATHVLRCFDYAPLCTFDDVRLQIPGVSDTDQQFIDFLIEAFAARAEAECSRKFRRATVTEVHSIQRGQNQIRVERFPIYSITSIKEDLSDPSSAQANAATDYDFQTLGDRGVIIMKHDAFLDGVATVQVVYDGGLVRSGIASPWVPHDLRMAAVRQVAYWFQRRTSLGVTGESVSGMSVSILQAQDLLEDVRAVLAHYRPRTLI